MSGGTGPRPDYAKLTNDLISSGGKSGTNDQPAHPNPHRDGRDGARKKRWFGPRKGR